MNPNKPNWMVVALDETRHWPDEIVAKAGKVFGIYVFDAHHQVNCCELTPSYEMHFLESLPRNFIENETERELLEEELREGNVDTDVEYHHCRVIDNLTMDCFEVIGHWTRYPDEDYGAERDVVIEWLRGNPREPRIVAAGHQQTETVQ